MVNNWTLNQCFSQLKANTNFLLLLMLFNGFFRDFLNNFEELKVYFS